MSDQSARLLLPFIAPSQAQKHVTHNEAIALLDQLVQMRVESFDATIPPVTPTPDTLYALGVGATGDWAGHDGELAAFVDNAWQFLPPQEGWQAVNTGSGSIWIYRSGGWQNMLDQIESLGVNAVADTTNRLSVSSDATLLNHDGTDHRLKLNKAGVADTASLLFQDGFSGRAEIGLTGSDDLAIKTSADGTIWSQAAVFDAASGAVGFGDGQVPQFGSNLRVADGQNGNAKIELQAGDAAADVFAAFEHASNGTSSQIIFTAKAPNSISLIDFSPVSSPTHSASTRFFRSTNTTGSTTFTIHNGDGTAGFESRFAGNLDTALAMSHNLGVGTTSPNAKLTVQGNVTPGIDNANTMGSSTHRWSSVWSVNGTIQTSDSRDKQVEQRIDTDLATQLIQQVDPVFFKWKKGGSKLSATPEDTADENPVPINAQEIEDARNDPVEPYDLAPLYEHSHPGKRRHAGFLAQDIKTAMDDVGIDFGAWGIEDIGDVDSRQFVRPDQLIPILWSAVQFLLKKQQA